MTFFNNALIILLINARFTTEVKGNFLFDGLYTDFSDDWYDHCSYYFILPMVLELLTPFLEFFRPYIMNKFHALRDRSWGKFSQYRTKCKISTDYAELNSGMNNELSYKYSEIMSITMISCFYGFGLPIIPILGFGILIVNYIFQKIVVFLHYRKPPLYDETLSKTAIFVLKWGAFLYVAIAYWILTNKQMFGNCLEPIAYQDEIENYS